MADVEAGASPPADVDGTDPARLSVRGYLRLLSGRVVRDVLPSGPVINSRRVTRRQFRGDSFVRALPPSARRMVLGVSVGWLAVTIGFWVWWLQPAHATSWMGFAITTVLFVPATVMQLYFVVLANRVRRFSPSLGIPTLRVAILVTKAPSEPWELVRSTLTAMLHQRFPEPYDVWLCDESPTAEVLAWCEGSGVRVSSRHGVEEYQRETWPRRRRCKEGNVAYFYDHHGYAEYDVVAQLDADHVPEPDYLAEIVRPFADPAVGYVAAPSICDANANASWAVRGRLHEEASFHGPQQLGHNDGLAPVCIGSHYAVRTSALREIGGIGPELAEDFTTSFLMNVAGWQGVFAIDAHAHGDGPTTFRAMATQEFQWSRSLVATLLSLAPRTFGLLPWRLRIRFALALSYYLLVTLTTVGGVVLVAAAAAFGIPWASVNFFVFVAFALTISALLLALAAVMRRNRLLRPEKSPLLSWENMLYVWARLPFICWGVVAAIFQQVVPRPIDFKVTPKGQGNVERLPFSLVAPFVIAAAVLTASALVGMHDPRVYGYAGLALLGALAYLLAAVAITTLHVSDAHRTFSASRSQALTSAWVPLLACAAVLPAFAYGVVAYGQLILHIVGW